MGNKIEPTLNITSVLASSALHCRPCPRSPCWRRQTMTRPASPSSDALISRQTSSCWRLSKEHACTRLSKHPADLRIPSTRAGPDLDCGTRSVALAAGEQKAWAKRYPPSSRPSESISAVELVSLEGTRSMPARPATIEGSARSAAFQRDCPAIVIASRQRIDGLSHLPPSPMTCTLPQIPCHRPTIQMPTILPDERAYDLLDRCSCHVRLQQPVDRRNRI